jgi:hypothetical protein
LVHCLVSENTAYAKKGSLYDIALSTSAEPCGARLGTSSRPIAIYIALANTKTNRIRPTPRPSPHEPQDTQDGPHQADRPQVHRRQGSPKAASHQGCPQERPRHRRSQEAPQVHHKTADLEPVALGQEIQECSLSRVRSAPGGQTTTKYSTYTNTATHSRC